MNQKGAVILEVTKGDNRYEFVMPIGAPFGEAYDAAFQALMTITEMAKNAAEAAKPVENQDLNG
jgi:hypothetical protein